MLTRLQEDFRIKCSRYWPDKSGTEDYGPFTVTVINETSHQNYIIREMAVHYNSLMNNMRSKLVNPTGKINSKKSKYYSPAESRLIVYQYQYIDWVEHGSPSNTSSLISFHQSILEGTHNKDGPIVVHCSNGVGRTGAYIAIGMAIEQAKNQNVIDIPAIVSDIRQQRMMMIQSIEQYMTVHDAVMEHVLCGVTEISGLDLRKHMHSLSLKKEDCYDQDGLTTGFESQFKSLEQICVLPKDATCTVGKQNPRKNRNNEILPNDQWRVPLKNELPDYVNASFVPSYKNDRAFIIAQSPMKETRRDFWKIIFDQEITAIVMLCPIMEKNEVCSTLMPL
jgi:protein tyrosine phosphatase